MSAPDLANGGDSIVGPREGLSREASGRPGPDAFPVIDAHIHIFPPEVISQRERFLALDPHFGALYANPRARLATAEDALASMDRNGIAGAFALGFGWSDLGLCRMHNDYLLDVQRRFPGRFACFAAMQPRDSSAALGELSRAIGAGLRGVGELMPHGQGYRLDDWAVVDPLAEALASLERPLVVHVSEPVGHRYPGKGDVSPVAAWELAQRHPALRVVFAHWGGGLPFYELMPEVATDLRQAFYDSAATTFLYRFEVFRVAAEICGAERILFGTDFPLLRQGPFLRRVRGLGLPGPAQRSILGENAVRLIGAVGTWPGAGGAAG
jgi:predicted TIM-barrel fold metal-dependent hydrolase